VLGFQLVFRERAVLKFVLVGLASWMIQNQQWVIEYLQEEVRVLKELLRKNG